MWRTRLHTGWDRHGLLLHSFRMLDRATLLQELDDVVPKGHVRHKGVGPCPLPDMEGHSRDIQDSRSARLGFPAKTLILILAHCMPSGGGVWPSWARRFLGSSRNPSRDIRDAFRRSRLDNFRRFGFSSRFGRCPSWPPCFPKRAGVVLWSLWPDAWPCVASATWPLSTRAWLPELQSVGTAWVFSFFFTILPFNGCLVQHNLSSLPRQVIRSSSIYK